MVIIYLFTFQKEHLRVVVVVMYRLGLPSIRNASTARSSERWGRQIRRRRRQAHRSDYYYYYHSYYYYYRY